MVERVCKECGKTYKTKPSQRLYFCGATCYSASKVGSGNPKWRGGRFLSKGYVYLYAPEHPYATKAGYVPEHRLVMETHIGRYLLPSEVVHHKNEIHGDNRIENLELCESTGKHSAEHHVRRNLTGKFGENSSTAPSRQKLSEAQARDVLRRRSKGDTYSAIASDLGVSVSCVAFIAQGRSWKWLQS